ncbi:MAG: class C sortase [Enterococcus sp.]
MIFVVIIGLGILCYPFVSDALNSYLDQQLIAHYQKKANEENQEAVNKLEEKQKENEKLAEEGNNPGMSTFNEAVSEEEAQEKSEKEGKTYYENHTIGAIYIPKIKVSLPIFDETNEILLQRGASLLEGTSYPIGGESTHSVISAHRGLPEAKLFSDLPKLKEGDLFYIDINNERHAYEVDQIEVIEPTETDALKIVPDEDLVTLMTCTPYMVNSHRLLVRGHRIPYNEEDGETIKKVSQHNQWKLFAWVAGILAVLLALGIFIWKKVKNKQKK